MAATNPFRASDLVAKYGWKSMIYLSNLGPQLLSEAQVLFVDSGHTNALDADDTEHGHSFEKPLKTIDYAVDLCTAAERSVILVAPGHNESLDGTSIDFDVSDVTVIGIGEGSNRPTIDFDSTDAIVSVGANNVHLVNLRFMPSIDDIVIGVDVEESVTGTILEKCEWAEMEETGDEFILGLDIKAGCTDTKVTNCLFRTELTGSACTHAIKLTGASDNVIIEKSRFIGNWSTAAIGGDTTLSTDVLIDDVTIKVKDDAPGISMFTGTTGIIRNCCIEATDEAVDVMIVADTMAWFNNYGVTVDGSAAELIGGGEVQAALVTYNLDHLAAVDTGIDADASLSGFVVDGSILGHIMAVDANPDEYDASLDSLQAISERMDSQNEADQIDLDAILEDTDMISGHALPAAPTALSLACFIASGGTALGQPLPVNMSLIDLIGNYTGDYNDTEANDNIKAHLDLIKTDAENAIYEKNPNAAFAQVYWVDADSGSDSNDGLSPGAAFATVAAAITANNLAFDADGDPQRTMYIHAKTYTENLVAFPKNCTVIGIGGKVRIQGYHSFSHAQNCRIHNIQFRSSEASVPIVHATGNCHGLEFHNCVFDCSAAVSECLKFSGNSSDMVVEKCRIGYVTSVANSPDIAIRFAGVAAQRGKVVDNQIYSTGIGIQIDTTMVSGNFLLVKDNVICAGNSTTDQMTIGINDKTSGPRGGTYVNNYISAADAIRFEGTSANVTSQNICIGNWVNEAGTSSFEDGSAN